ncbi:MAG: hypothetical protein ACK50J_30170, partial [Planctomyces sp.]
MSQKTRPNYAVRDHSLNSSSLAETRRSFLSSSGLGFGSLALGAILQREGYGRDGSWMPPDGQPHSTPRAKSVIWLFM